MAKKFLALASVTAVSGLLIAVAGAGCSTTTFVWSDAGGGSMSDASMSDASMSDASRGDASRGDGAVTPPDAGEEDSGPTTTCPSDVSPTADDLKQALGAPWKGPAAPKSVCVQTDIDRLRALFASGEATFDDVKKAMSTDCAACVFTKPTDANWGLLVSVGTTSAYPNYGACLAAGPDGPKCGEAYFNMDTCDEVVCQGCGSESAVASCQKKAGATNGVCMNAFGAALNTACPNLKAQIEGPCESFVKAVITLCSGGAGAGLDAGE